MSPNLIKGNLVPLKYRLTTLLLAIIIFFPISTGAEPAGSGLVIQDIAFDNPQPLTSLSEATLTFVIKNNGPAASAPESVSLNIEEGHTRTGNYRRLYCLI